MIGRRTSGQPGSLELIAPMTQNVLMTATPRRRWVLHVDLDQFIAAVEVLRNPELAGKPVVVGGRGDPTERGVVSTASYEARAFGVGSGMPLRVAAKKLPDAIFLPVDGEAYTAASNVVMETLRGLGVVVEVMGWDEAFLGVETDDPIAFARRVHDEVFEATALHCSVGIGDNKLRAKIATDFGKPQGVYTLTQDNWFEVMGERGTDALWGIGKKTARKLATLGITTVAELAATDDGVLAAAFGPKTGPWIGTKGRGVDLSPVSAEPWIPRSHSRETTFQQDLDDWSAVTEEVRTLALRVREDIMAADRMAVRVTLKVRYVPFETHTTTAALREPTFDPAVISDAAAALVDRFDHTRQVRLMGVRLEMTPVDQTLANNEGDVSGT
ncbi:DNA polymerase IV 1 [Rhodococcus sp. B10]|nr:DNA polymerase IV 1 [Rhodococcus sp. B10]